MLEVSAANWTAAQRGGPKNLSKYQSWPRQRGGNADQPDRLTRHIERGEGEGEAEAEAEGEGERRSKQGAELSGRETAKEIKLPPVFDWRPNSAPPATLCHPAKRSARHQTVPLSQKSCSWSYYTRGYTLNAF